MRRPTRSTAWVVAAALAPLALSACAEPPDHVLSRALAAIETGRDVELARFVADDYTDPLGGREVLLADVRDLARDFGRVTVRPSALSIVASGPAATAEGRLEVELVGEPTTWRMTGPLRVELRRDGDFLIRSGLLAELRDVRRLAAARRAALEANDAVGYARLLHPTYRDGDVGREETADRLQRDLGGVRIRFTPTLYKLELRGPSAHLDEHYQLTVGDRALPPAVARLTLLPAAGLWKIAAGLYPAVERARNLEPGTRSE